MTEGHNITGFKPSGGGFGTRKGQSAYANNDPEIFELDKLHIQKIEPSTTEEEFTNYVLQVSGVKPESTKFIHRDGIDWWFCFQKFENDSDAATALGVLRDHNFKGMILNAMYSRRREHMRSHREKMKQQQQYQCQNQFEKPANNVTAQYQDYYQDQSLPHAGCMPPAANKFGRGGANQHFNRGDQFHRGGGGYHNSFGETVNRGGAHQYKTMSSGGRPFDRVGRGGGGAFNSAGRGGYDSANSNRPMVYSGMQSRLGPPANQREGSSKPHQPKAHRVKKEKPTAARETGDYFCISDLHFVDVRKPFKAECVRINSHKDLILQVTKLHNDEIVHSEDFSVQMQQSFNSAGQTAENLDVLTAGTVCLVKTESDSGEDLFRRAVIMYSPSEQISSSAPAPTENEKDGKESSEISVELIDFGEAKKVEPSKLFKIAHSCIVKYPVSLFHGCFSHIEVEKEQLDAIVENLREALMHDPTAKDEVLYSVMRRVYNRVDIEAQLDEDYTLTKVLYESNDVLITEASLQWKRYPQLAPIRIKRNVQYTGKITQVTSPTDMYVQVQSIIMPEELNQNGDNGQDVHQPQATNHVAAKIELECEKMRQEGVLAMLYETMPNFEMPEIPYYTPFPFELVCVETNDSGWCRANIVQFEPHHESKKTTADVYLVDSGRTMRKVSVSTLKPVPREFALTTDVKSPTSDISISDPTSMVIPAQAIKVSLPGDLLELSSPEMLDEFKGLVIGSCVQLKVVSMPRKFSNDPFLCNLQLVSQDDGSGANAVTDLAAFCESKGLIKAKPPPKDAAEIFSPNETSSSIEIKREPNSESGSGDGPGRVMANGNEGIPRSHLISAFDEDSSTQMSSEYIDIDNTASEAQHDEALREEVAHLRDRVQCLEDQLAEMQEFKRSVVNQLNKFKKVFSD